MSRPFQHFRAWPTGGHTSQDLLQYSLCVLMSNGRDPSPTELMACIYSFAIAKREFKLRANDYLNVRKSAHLAGSFDFRK